VYHNGSDSIVSVNDEDAFVGRLGDLNYTYIPAPSNLTLQSSTTTSWNLTWTDNATTETGQAILYGPPFEKQLFWPFTENKFIEANVTSFTITGMTANELYEAVVFAHYNNEVFSDSSISVMDSTVDFVGVHKSIISQIRIYPNPSTGIFTIEEIGKSTVSGLNVTDMSGRVVYVEYGFKSELDLSFLEDGLYYIRILMDSGGASQYPVTILH
jgi:hypothetical protein